MARRSSSNSEVSCETHASRQPWRAGRRWSWVAATTALTILTLGGALGHAESARAAEFPGTYFLRDADGIYSFYVDSGLQVDNPPLIRIPGFTRSGPYTERALEAIGIDPANAGNFGGLRGYQIPNAQLVPFIDALGGTSIDKVNLTNRIGQQVKASQKNAKGFNIFNWLGNLLLNIAQFFLVLFRWLLLVLAAIAGKFIDFSLAADFRNAATPGSGYMLVTFWTFTRDALNFVFILGLLTIAFATIAGIEGYNAQRMVPKILFAALLVNFSLAIGVAFVHLGDVLCATAIKGLTGQAACGSVKAAQGGTGSGAGQTLSLKLANAASLGELNKAELEKALSLLRLDSKSAGAVSGGPAVREFPLAGDFTQHLGIFVADLATVFTMFVFVLAFLALALMFFVRMIVIFILLVLSPVPYALGFIPRAAEYAARWWASFIKYVLFLPVTVFFLVLAAKLQEGSSGNPRLFHELRLQDSLQLLTGGFGGNVTEAIIVNVFQALFTTVFILVAMAVGLQLGIYGAQGALGFVRSGAIGAALAGPRTLWRRTGEPFMAAREEQKKAATRARREGLFGRLGRATVGTPRGRPGEQMRRRQEDEEVKDLTARGATLKELNLSKASHARYALDRELITEPTDFETALGAVRVNSPEFNKGAKKYQERYVVAGTNFVEKKRNPTKTVTTADYEKTLRGLSNTDAYEAFARESDLQTGIRSGTIQPTENLARGVVNANDYRAGRAIALGLAAKGQLNIHNPGVVEKRLRDARII